jgi:SAM-dependent methyltransferase
MTTTWWPEHYDDLLAEMLLDDTSDIEPTLRFLVDKLRLAPGARVFDQCCGTGRLASPRAKWGADVIGVEQAARYVETARARAAGLTATFDVGDAFEYVPAKPCAAAINWWTSFGYLPDDDANVRMLRRAFEALAPGGRFALDYPNAANLCAVFRPHEITRKGTITMLRESTLDLPRGLLHKRWTFVTDDRRVERTSTLRLYAPDRLVQLLASVGFVDIELFGGVDGAPLALDRPRCIAVGVRP